MKPPASLYIHVPFCPTICPYCDFHKMRRHEGLVEAYLKRLNEEAQALYEKFPTRLETIYFGGGTPSLLTDSELESIVKTLSKLWGFPARLETTLEADPLTFDAKRLSFFKESGFNRLSIGLQSTQDKILKFLGRLHSGEQGLEAVSLGLEAGFEVSADLITGISDQDTAKDLHQLAQTGVPHISVYSLTIEPLTPFALQGIERNEDKEAEDYDLTNEVLQAYGYNRYEVSSHAQRGHESKHNQVYWQGEYFLALGPSAAGFVPHPPVLTEVPLHRELGGLGVRYVNPTIKSWLQGQVPEIIQIDAERYLQDLLMTSLRTRRGLNLATAQERTGIDLLAHYHELIEELQKHHLLSLEPPYLKSTSQGLLQLNGILEHFITL